MKIFFIGRLAQIYLDYYLHRDSDGDILLGQPYYSWITGMSEIADVEYFFFTDTLSLDTYRHSSRQFLRTVHPLRSFRRAFVTEQNRRLRAQLRSFQPDVIVTYPLELMDSEILDGYPVVGWIGNDPDTFIENSRKQISRYALAVSSAPYLLEKATQYRAKSTAILLQTVDSDYYKPMDLSDAEKLRYGCDVVFAGQWQKDRETDIAELRRFDFKIFGENWHRAEDIANIASLYHGTAWTDRVRVIYNAARIGYNRIWQNFPIHGGNLRSYEIAACGAPQIITWSQQLANYFEDGREVIFYRDSAELRKKLEFYLERPDELAAIGREARRKVESRHDCRIRMRELHDLILEKVIA